MSGRGVNTVADLRARSVVDASGCWRWQHAMGPDGVPRIHTFCHRRGEKTVLSGPQAVWNIAHSESPAPFLVFRACGCTACVNPVHMRQARTYAEIGLHQRRSGIRVGTCVEQRRANGLKGLAAAGIVVTAPEIVAAIQQAPDDITGRELSRLHGVSEQTVSRIRRRQRHHPQAAA